MALNWDKYDIEIRNDDAIQRNRIFFDFIKQMLNRLDGFYLREGCLLIYEIMEYQMRKRSAAEIEELNREIKARKKRNKDKSKPSPKKIGFVNKRTRTSRATISISN